MNLIKKFNKLEKYTKYSIFVIVLFSIIVLFLTSIYHVSGDGCWHIPAGKFIANNLKIPLFEPLGRDEPFWSPPVYHIIVAVVYYIFSAFNNNIANFAVKFVSSLFGILSLIFSFLVVKKLCNSRTAFYSTIFLAFIPIVIDYSIFSYVESTLMFFVILSVYFLINGKFVLSGIAAGLSILAKYNGVFIIPVLIYIMHRRFGKNKFYKNALIIALLSLLIAAPWLARNWILLGNPIWPFLNFAFNGLESKSYAEVHLLNLASPSLYASTYLGFFGVPDGNYNTFSFLRIPYLKVLLAIWLIGTFIFMIPLLIGFFNINKLRLCRKLENSKNSPKLKNANFMIVWILSYLVLFLLYAINVGSFVSRMVLPAFPAIAAFWAFGYEKLQGNKFRKLINLVFILVIIGFVFTEFAKIRLASNAWGFYKEDFEWANANTKSNAVFVANGQCVPYNIERTSLYANDESLKKADYVWVNQNFALDKRSILDEQSLKIVQAKNFNVVYSNKKTGTTIYSARQ